MKIISNMCFCVLFFSSSLVCCAGCSEETEVRIEKDKEEHHVLCLGNSITRHSPYDAVNWYSDHGMAASKPENDYCHVLQSLMRNDNANTTVTPCNIANWERDFTLSLDQLSALISKARISW